ncbi:MAG: type II secretion system F family protein [Verrucomicrobia bacterium]|nr:type II secretion system F family protein [Verrucomicrobiota bacterium]MBV9659107.1 type II secretion system F family protein [Verrucomicrobiota bacterium]
MFTYAFQARDSSGKIIAGVQDALNEENAITSLMSRGLMVLAIQQKSAASKRKKVSTIKDSDLVMVTRQLATMVDAGIPLVGSLTALYETADPKKQAGMRNVLADVTGRVQGGESFHGALAKHPLIFNRLFISMVKAGEAGGLLAEILDRLAGFLESTARLRKKIKSAMTYPVAVISIAFLITMFLIVKVVPVFASIFKDFGKPLPAPTQFLVDLSDFVRGSWWVLILMAIAAFFGLKAFLKTQRGRELWNQWQLKLPVFGPLIHKISMSRFARTFAQLIRSGVPILEVIDIVGGSAGNIVVERAIKGVGSDVEKGDNLSVAMSKKAIFPPMMLRMVSAGEATGKIDEMLEKMADFWDEEIEATLNALTSLLEPILIVFLGVIVGGIVIALFLPIFKLSEVVSS